MTTYQGLDGIAKLKAKIEGRSKEFAKEIAASIVIALVEDGQAYLGKDEYGGIQFPNNDSGRYVNSWHTNTDGGVNTQIRVGSADGGDSITDALMSNVTLGLPINITNSTPEAVHIQSIGWTTENSPIRADFGWDDKSPYRPLQTVTELLPSFVPFAVEKAIKLFN